MKVLKLHITYRKENSLNEERGGCLTDSGNLNEVTQIEQFHG